MIKKQYSNIDVVTMAKIRIKNIFKTASRIELSVSGGKDSICLNDLIFKMCQSGEIDKSKLIVDFIDGFHRWTVSGREPLKTLLKNKVPVVVVDHKDHAEGVYGTITHNRAGGTHLLEPMKAIVKESLDEGKSTKEICKELGMKPEEVFRLSDFTREDFLKMMIKDQKTYNKSYQIKKF